MFNANVIGAQTCVRYIPTKCYVNETFTSSKAKHGFFVRVSDNHYAVTVATLHPEGQVEARYVGGGREHHRGVPVRIFITGKLKVEIWKLS